VDKFVARQPIFDAKKNIFAYELLFRSGLDNFFHSDKPDQASCSVVVDSFLLFGMQSLTGKRRAFLNFTRNLLAQQYATLLPPDQAVIEILEDVRPDPQIVAACQVLKTKGYVIALDDFVLNDASNPLIKVADIIKVDFLNTSVATRRDLARQFVPRGIKMLAEKVESHEQFREAVAAGYTYFQGHFFCKPEVVAGRDIPAFKTNYLALLRTINKKDPDLNEVEQVIKRESSLCYKLLRYLNSAAFGFKSEITSIRHALSLIGIGEIRKWTSLVALAGMGEDRPAALVITSMVRARFCELLASTIGQTARAAEFFLMGLFSIVDAILDRPMSDILNDLPVSADIKEALLGGNNRFRQVHELVLVYEKGNWQKTALYANQIRLAEYTVTEAYLGSVAWAQDIFQVDQSIESLVAK
jgi:c-di-GMP-related signal transduction protein